MRTLRERSSALAAAVVMTATLLASGPLTEEAEAQPARRRGPSTGLTPKRSAVVRGHHARNRTSRATLRVRQAPPVPAGDVWTRLRQCESGGRYDRNSGNGFYGAYQFLPSTWRALGFRGMPHEAAPELQDAAARKLQTRSGWGQWPACSRRIGVR
jgi:resuscitation-promoting factor RpfB